MKRSCENCRYSGEAPPGSPAGLGTCRREPPGVIIEEITDQEGVHQATVARGVWPLVMANEWCGRWKRMPIEES